MPLSLIPLFFFYTAERQPGHYGRLRWLGKSLKVAVEKCDLLRVLSQFTSSSRLSPWLCICTSSEERPSRQLKNTRGFSHRHGAFTVEFREHAPRLITRCRGWTARISRVHVWLPECPAPSIRDKYSVLVAEGREEWMPLRAVSCPRQGWIPLSFFFSSLSHMQTFSAFKRPRQSDRTAGLAGD